MTYPPQVVTSSGSFAIISEVGDINIVVEGTPSTLLPSTAFSGHSILEVDVIIDFGATGDGITNDWQAIENAGLYLERHGGGRMFFPAGTYNLPEFGKQITIRDNVEYFGDGYASHIIGNNCAFCSKGAIKFGRNTLFGYTYYPASNIVAGDNVLTATTPADAAHFAVGDIILASSTTFFVHTAPDTEPYYIEVNRVTGVNVSTGQITLEDAIDDGWTSIKIANVTADFNKGYNIHGLFIEATAGSSFFLTGSYKSTIHNCWIKCQASVLSCNAMVRSTAHDLICTIGETTSVFEIEVGSVRASIYDCEVHVSGNTGAGNPPFYCQEFSRRTSMHNIRLYARQTDVIVLFRVEAGGHSFKNIYVSANSVQKVLDYFGNDNALDQLNLGGTFEDIVVDAPNGFQNGLVFANAASASFVKDVSVRNFVCNGSAFGDIEWIWFFSGTMQNLLFDGVVGPGFVAANMTGVGGGLNDFPELAGPMTNDLINVEIKNSTFTRVANQVIMQKIHFANNRRYGNKLPQAKYIAASNGWNYTAANSKLIGFTVPANSGCCWGDCIVIKASFWWDASFGLSAGTLALVAFGNVLTTVALPSGAASQNVVLDIRLDLVSGSMVAPNKWTATGSVILNSVHLSFEPFFFVFDPTVANTVELQGWVVNPVQFITAKFISLTYVPFENRAQAGL